MASQRSWRVVLPQRRLRLGEGLHWDAQRGCLWFVDILERKVLCWDGVSADAREWTVPQRVGWVLPRPVQGDLLAGFQHGVVRLELDGALRWEWVCRLFPDDSPMRLNDAKLDAAGRLWAGTLNHGDESRPDGALYRIDVDRGRAEVVDSGYGVANGPAIHPDGRLFLHTDSPRRTIYAFDLDPQRGTLANKRVWKVLREDEGYPDGMNFDAEGCLWLAHWGGGRISRHRADGTTLEEVRLPAVNVTNVCPAGFALGSLVASSATAGLDPRDEDGAIFRVDGVGG